MSIEGVKATCFARPNWETTGPTASHANGEARLLSPAPAGAVARGVPALLARDARAAGAAPRRRPAHPALRADPHARPCDERGAGAGSRRAGGLRRRRRAVVGQRRGDGRRHLDRRRARRRPGAVRRRAPLHRPRAIAAVAVRAAPVRGRMMDAPAPAPVRLIVWSDYLCPWCYVAATRLHRVQEEFGDRVELEWRSYLRRPYPAPPRTREKSRTYTRTGPGPPAEPDAPAFRVWESDAGP